MIFWNPLFSHSLPYESNHAASFAATCYRLPTYLSLKDDEVFLENREIIGAYI